MPSSCGAEPALLSAAPVGKQGHLTCPCDLKIKDFFWLLFLEIFGPQSVGLVALGPTTNQSIRAKAHGEAKSSSMAGERGQFPIIPFKGISDDLMA